MSDNALLFFEAFYAAIAQMDAREMEHFKTLHPSMEAELTGLDLVAANEVVEDKLATLSPDTELLRLYDAVREFQDSAFGKTYRFSEDNELVESTWRIAKRLSGNEHPAVDFVSQLIDILDNAIGDRLKGHWLNKYVAANAAQLNEYRFKQLEQSIRNGASTNQIVDDEKSSSEFTHTQQAIAIHYLFHEALGISGIDNTRLMEFAHLLSAKKIPLSKETGKENIRNSGIKSAFNKAWKKEDANHLSDLRFVLRFFKPLNVVGATGIQNAVTALEKRIARISEKLSREKD